MLNWNHEDEASCIAEFHSWGSDIAQRVYASRLIGVQDDLVLHGGGNTSVKTRVRDLFGQPLDVLAVKGSGWDLARIEPPGLPQVRLEPLQALRHLDALSDEAMVNQLRAQLLDSTSPNPSVETLLHAFIPRKFIDHAHADAILTLVNQSDAEQRVRDLFGNQFGIVPYVMPGFALSKLAAEIYDQNPDVDGLILINHGIFTFAGSAEASYAILKRAVETARASLTRTTHATAVPQETFTREQAANAILCLRSALTNHPSGVGHQTIYALESEHIDHLVQRDQWQALATRGPMTPDLVIRTKQKPLLLELDPNARDAWPSSIMAALDRYLSDYNAYFEANQAACAQPKTKLNPLPKVALLPGVGILGIAPDRSKARQAAELAHHSLGVALAAEEIGRYNPLPDSDIFDMEYWSLEQAKLGRSKAAQLSGQIALLTGACGGIGRAIATTFLDQGCHLFLTDINSAALNALQRDLHQTYPDRTLAQAADIRTPSSAQALVQSCVAQFGGIDILLSNAGRAFTGPIHNSTESLIESFDINFWSHQHLASAAATTMQDQSTGGSLIFNASKSAFNPGPGFGPYSVAKAALIALAKQYAVDLAPAVRVNVVNPDRVRTKLFDPKLVKARAQARGLTEDAYFAANMLGQEVSALDVARTFLFAQLSTRTTGSVFVVDGGNIAASPR